jgi:hypothetical protein
MEHKKLQIHLRRLVAVARREEALAVMMAEKLMVSRGAP